MSNTLPPERNGETPGEGGTAASFANAQRGLDLITGELDRGRFAASAATPGAPVSAAAANGAVEPAIDYAATVSDEAQTAKILSELLSSTMRSQLSAQANVARELLDESKMLKALVMYTFRWKGDSVEAPSAMAVSRQAIGDMFDGLDASKKIYVYKTKVKYTANSAPYHLALDLEGLEGKEKAKGFSKIDATHHTWFLPPQSQQQLDQTVHTMQLKGDKSLKRLIDHGQADYKAELNAMTSLGSHNTVLVETQSRIGRIMKANQEHLTTNPEGLQPIAPDLPYYRVSKQDAALVLDRYNNEVLQALPFTDMAQVRARVSRLDHGVGSGKPFASTKGAAGLTPTQRDVHGSAGMEHEAYVMVEYSIIDPDHLERLSTVTSSRD